MVGRALAPLLLLACVPSELGTFAWSDEQHRPNIVFILADDLGPYELGCYGQTRIRTPHLDLLASQGMRLTHHDAGAPVCAPSRCSLLTGKSSARCQIRDNRDSGNGDPFPGQWPLRPDSVTFAKVLQQAGYVTGVFGKWGLGPDDSTGAPLQQGFQRFFGYHCQRLAHSYYPPYLTCDDQRVTINEHPVNAHQQCPEGEVVADHYRADTYAPDVIVEAALAFMEQHATRPFLLYLPLIEPHVAMHPPQRWIDLYPLEWDEEHGPYRGQNGYLPHPRPRGAYAAMISHLDHHVGRILAKLDELQLTDQTIVVFTSDNGPTHGGRDERFSVGGAACEFFRSTGAMRGFKGSCYEGGLRVPCIVRWPGKIPPGSISGFPCFFADWFPTIMAAANVTADDDQRDGINLLPVLMGKEFELPRPGPMLWEFHGYGGWVAARWQDWKWLQRDVMASPPGIVELYDLVADPGEKVNRAAEHAELCAWFRQAYLSGRSVEPDFPWPYDEASRAQRQDDWIHLFDGQTLSGWVVRGGHATYFVEDGCIVGQTVAHSPNTFLCTQADYDNFELELEFKVDPQLNSGIQIRSHSLPEYRNGVVHGYQVEIDPSDRGWTGGIYDESRRGWLRDVSGDRRARYAFRPGKWNHLRIVAHNEVIRTWVNGIRTAELKDSLSSSGFIGLQVHGVGARQDALQVRFRNIRIRLHPTADALGQEQPFSPPNRIFPSDPEVVVEGLGFGEGPTLGPDGLIYFSDIPNDQVYVYDPESRVAQIYLHPSGKSNGLFFTPGGRLLACESETRAVTLRDETGRRQLVDSFEGRRLNSPNDLVPDGFGGFYFTDPRYGDRQSMELDFEGVFYVDRRGNVTLVERGLTRPNGIEMSPDGKRLYLADHAGATIWVYDVPEPGRLENKVPFANVGSDGMTVDLFGNLFVTWQREVIVFSPEGSELDRLTLPTNPTNVVLRGGDLFITTPRQLYRVATWTRGLIR